MKKFLVEDDNLKIEVEDDIIYGTWKTAAIDADMGRKCLELRLRAAKRENQILVIDARKVRKISKEARHYLASAASYEKVIASAIVVENTIASHLVNFFLKVNRPAVPSKMFSSETHAVGWVKSMRDFIIKTERV